MLESDAVCVSAHLQMHRQIVEGQFMTFLKPEAVTDTFRGVLHRARWLSHLVQMQLYDRAPTHLLSGDALIKLHAALEKAGIIRNDSDDGDEDEPATHDE